MVDPSDGNEFEFYQSEPLTSRLRGLIRSYPAGIGIFKELIQNADDAGARVVRFTMDWRVHRTDRLPDPRMAVLMGPALLAYNDAAFTDRDFESIRRLGDSAKVEDVNKTGRFGLGFNSVYNVTDWPSFISRERAVFLDPHASAIPGTSRGVPGMGWKFGAMDWWSLHPDLMAAYVAGGLPERATDFQGTLFRLPLRTEAHAQASEICQRAFDQAAFEEVLAELVRSGEELLLFLKSVERLEVIELPADGSPAQERFRVETRNGPEVGAARRTVRDAVGAGTFNDLLQRLEATPCLLAPVSYRHEIVTAGPAGEIRSTWRVVHALQVDAEGKTIGLMRDLFAGQEKAIPWAGAAARVACSEPSSPVSGRAYCFLPTPVDTNLPVHVNGYFDLDAARTGLSSPDGNVGLAKTRGLWNLALVAHAVAPAYAQLLLDARSDLAAEVPAYYALWPTAPGHPCFMGLPAAVVGALGDAPVIHTPEGWRAASRVFLLPAEKFGLEEPLLADAWTLALPRVPVAVQEIFKGAGRPLTSLRPQVLRDRYRRQAGLGIELADAPHPSLRRREWVEALLKYALADNVIDVRGLPFLIRADGRLDAFGYTQGGKIFLAGDVERDIFRGFRSWFIDEAFAKAVELKAMPQAGLVQMSGQDVVERLKEILGAEPTRPWDPGGAGLPNAPWIAKVFKYLADLAQVPTNVDNIPLVPGNDGRLHKVNRASTPLMVRGTLGPSLAAALRALEIPVVDAPGPTLQALDQVRARHGDRIVGELEGAKVINRIAIRLERLKSLDDAGFEALLVFLLETKGLSKEDRRRLAALPLLPVVGGTRVSADNDDVVLPGGFVAPPFQVEALVVDTRKSPAAQQLAALLDVTPLTRSVYVMDYLLRRIASTPVGRQEALVWFQQNYEAARAEAERNGVLELFDRRVAAAEFVPCVDGQFRRVGEVYDPEATAVLAVLGDRAPLPAPTIGARWITFLTTLGLRKIASGDDIVTYVDGLIERAADEGLDSVGRPLLDLLDHLSQYWPELANEHVSRNGASTLAEALRRRAWLPAATKASELDRFPAAKAPEPRLYKPNEIYPVQRGHLIASQVPLLPGRQPSAELAQAIGLPGYWLPPALVRAHLEEVVAWVASQPDAADFRPVAQTVNAIATYVKQLANSDEPALRAFVAGLAVKPCLWDPRTKRFWPPAFAFSTDVSYLGGRRIGLPGWTADVDDAYRLMGRRHAPTADDLVSVLEELRDEAGDDVLEPETKTLALAILARLAQLHENGECDFESSSGPVLTGDGRLAPPDELLVLDAPWWEQGLPPSACVDGTVRQPLAYAMGAHSAARVLEERVDGQPVVLREGRAAAWCDHVRETLCSPEFRRGLARLAAHVDVPFDPDAWSWLADCRLQAAERIETSLYWDERLVAAGLAGDFHHDEAEGTIVMRAQRPEAKMGQRLATLLARRLGTSDSNVCFAIANALEAEPSEIELLLDNDRIRRSALDDPLDLPPVAELLIPEPFQPWGDEPFEESGFQEAVDGHGDEEEVEEEADASEEDADDAPALADVQSDGRERPEGDTGDERSFVAPNPKVTPKPQMLGLGDDVGPGPSPAGSDQALKTPAPGGAASDRHRPQAPGASEIGAGTAASDHSAAPFASGPRTSPNRRDASRPTPEATGARGTEALSRGGSGGRGPWAMSGGGLPPRATNQAGPHRQRQEGARSEAAASSTTIPLPSSHTTFHGTLQQRSTPVAVDEGKLRARCPDAEILPWEASEPRAERWPTPGYTGELPPVNEGTATLFASSFENGALWLRTPRPAALFPPAEAEVDAQGRKGFSAVLMNDDEAPPILLRVDYERHVVFVDPDHRDRVVDFFVDHGLLPGCELTLVRLEAGGYRLGYRPAPSTVPALPVLEMGEDGKVVVRTLVNAVEVPCAFNHRLLMGQQRFADPEARVALETMSLTAPDALNAILGLLDGRTGSVSLDDLYLMCFQVRPVSWGYFAQLIERNSGEGALFDLVAGAVSLNAGPVAAIIVPRRGSPPRPQVPADLDYTDLADRFRLVLAAAGAPTEIAGHLVDAVRDWQAGVMAMEQPVHAPAAGWASAFALTPPALHPLLQALEERTVEAPEPGYDVARPDGLVVGTAEFAWPEAKVALLLPEEATAQTALEALGWRCLDLDAALQDDAVLAKLVAWLASTPAATAPW